jgi:hypothetical protein
MATNLGLTTPSVGSYWYNAGSTVSITAIALSAVAVMRCVFNGWTGTGSGSYTGTNNPVSVTMNGPVTEKASWTVQYQVTFKQTGLDSSADSRTVLTVGSTTYAYNALPINVWVNSGTAFSWSSPVSGGSGKQFVLTGSSGLASPISNSGTATGTYKIQYQLTVSSAHDTPSPASGTWFDSGTRVTESVKSPADQSGGTRYRCTGWNSGTGSVPGTGSTTSATFQITLPSSIMWNWIAQYQIIFDASSNVKTGSTAHTVTVNSVDQTAPYTTWMDGGAQATFAYKSPIQSSVSSNTRYSWISTSGLSQTLQSNTFTVSVPGTIIGTYKTQYKVTFAQSGIANEFTGAALKIDSTTYTSSNLPVSLWWDQNSQHTFQYLSPLVGITHKYTLSSTTGTSSVGMTTSQNGVTTITVTGSGTIIGNYTKTNKQAPSQSEE